MLKAIEGQTDTSGAKEFQEYAAYITRAIPLMEKDEVLGVLNIESEKPLSKEDLTLFDVLAHHATITLRLYKNQINFPLKKSNQPKNTIKKRKKRRN